MPLRRRPQEPSPRLLALLQAGDTARGIRQQEAAPADEPWVPHRDWIEDAAAGGQGSLKPGAQGSLRVEGRGRRAGADGGHPAEPALPEPPTPPEPPRPVPRAAPPPPGRHRRPSPPGPALLVLPAALRGARVSGPRAAIAGMVALVLLAAALFGVRVAWARAASAPEAVPQPGSTAQRASAVASRSAGSDGFAGAGDRRPGGPTTPANGAGAGELVVHVVGQVKRPGVVVLAVGARVRDAVAKAGGARSGADLGALNLARPLVDGEQLRVPRPGEAPAPADPGAAGAGAGGSGGGSPGGAGGPGGAVNLNTANQAVLEELPGVGPVLAQRIIDWRSEHGRFASVDELAEVSGIGEKMFAQLQGKVTV